VSKPCGGHAPRLDVGVTVASGDGEDHPTVKSVALLVLSIVVPRALGDTEALQGVDKKASKTRLLLAGLTKPLGTGPVRPVPGGTGPVPTHKSCLYFFNTSESAGFTGLPTGFLNRGNRSGSGFGNPASWHTPWVHPSSAILKQG
jgi:hypothetical protein